MMTTKEKQEVVRKTMQRVCDNHSDEIRKEIFDRLMKEFKNEPNNSVTVSLPFHCDKENAQVTIREFSGGKESETWEMPLYTITYPKQS